MSLATRCPQCNTTFRVVSDQLKLRQGLVKCGVCNLVFNGIEHLYYAGSEESPEPLRADTRTDAAAELQSENTAASTDASSDDESLDDATAGIQTFDATKSDDDIPISLPPIPAIENDPPWQHLPDTRPPWPTLSPELLPESLLEDREAAAEVDLESPAGEAEAPFAEPVPLDAGAQTETRDSVLGPMTLLVLDGKPLDEHALPEFLLDAPPRPRWVKVVLALACLATVLGLASQWIFQYRSELALQWPQTTRLAVTACSVVLQTSETACTPALPQHINAIRVTSAELQAGANVAEDDTRYTLMVSLHNDDALTQAWPALEVMLTNARNQQMVRRVITPQEYLLARSAGDAIQERLRQGLAASSEEALTLQLRVRSNEAVIGYAVGAFYP
jgi:predicted Zn finger-like uncharacterized protein